ncbi:MULE domain-containing protein, partial [Aphis craccivora]
ERIYIRVAVNENSHLSKLKSDSETIYYGYWKMNFSFIEHYENCRISDTEIKTRKRKNRSVVKLKIHIVTEKNPGYIDFKIINEIMISRHPSKNIRTIAFKYYALQLHQLMVERSFSHFKNILRPNRQHLRFNNLKEIIIIQ